MMAMAGPETLFRSELSIRSAVADVRVASDWLARDGKACGVPEEQVGRLDLCLNEALANIISHGGESAAAQPIRLLLQVGSQQSAGEACVTVSDAGHAFDATTATLKAQAQTLYDATPGGLGLLMMRKFSDDLTYLRADGRNVLTITVRWN